MTVAPFAQWRGPIPNKTPGGMHLPSLGLVLHVMESSLAAADGWFHNPAAKASAHFGVDQDGTIVQWVEWEDKAWAEVAGNPSYHSVETSGFNNQALTAPQVAGVAKIYAEGMRRYGWPNRLANVPGEQGLGTHAMGGSAWGGHTACPGPQRTAQRVAILVAAGAPPAPVIEEEEMVRLFTHNNGEYIGVFGHWCRPIPTQAQWDFYVRAGIPVNDADGRAEVANDTFSQMAKLPVAE